MRPQRISNCCMLARRHTLLDHDANADARGAHPRAGLHPEALGGCEWAHLKVADAAGQR